MNRRIYDPSIGRFISPDPNVPDAAALQSFNRCACVRNRPLSVADPSEFIDADPYTGSGAGMAGADVPSVGHGSGGEGPSAFVPSPCRFSAAASQPDGGGFGAPPTIDKFKAQRMVDLLLPTTDERELTLSRYTQPEPEQCILLEQLRLTLPSQPPPTMSAAQVRAVQPASVL